MKKLILLAGLYCLQLTLHAKAFNGPIRNNKAPMSANERAMTHFKENYAWVEDASWYNTADKNLYCVFHQGNMIHRLFYDRLGYWQYTQISYPPTVLAKNVKELVMHNFAGYQISFVNEILSNNSEPVYIINIENKNNIKVIRVAGDDIEVKEDLNRL
jgi:hypothetical protein